MGKIEDAIESMTKARDTNPHDVESYYSLAVCYFNNEQFDECAVELLKAEKISPPQNVIQNIYVDILSGKTNDAPTLLKRSLETKAINKYQILRDPNLGFLLNLQKFMASQ
jgi:Flp pilus assembly protein TadD